MSELAVMDDTEREVRDALVAYKTALVMANYRNLWHRIGCWMGDGQATEAERQLQVALKQAKAVANRSEEHKGAVRSIATQQPIGAREADGFLALLA